MQTKRFINKNGILDICVLEYVYIFVADVQIFVNPRCVDASGVKQLVQIPGMRYSYFTWGTISQRLLKVAPRKQRQKVHVHKTNTKTNTQKW